MSEVKRALADQFTRLDTLLLRYRLRPHPNDGAAMNPHRGQGRVLAILKLQPEIGQNELGYLLDISKQALAELLAKLEKNGFITRAQSERDRRSCIVKLTDKGREVPFVRFDAVDSGRQMDAALDCLSEGEQRDLSGYLGRMISALEEKYGGGDDEDDYAGFFRQRFFARHGFGPDFGRGFGHYPNNLNGGNGHDGD